VMRRDALKMRGAGPRRDHRRDLRRAAARAGGGGGVGTRDYFCT
jgi:hypothetical protein